MAWTAPKTWVAAEIVDEAEMNAHLRDNLNYLNDSLSVNAQRTTDSSSTSSSTVLDVLSAPAFTPISASRLIKITGQWRSMTVTTDPGIYTVYIREGSTSLNQQNHELSAPAVGLSGGSIVTYVASPSAAAHTYKLSMQRASGTGTAVMNAAATYPIQIIVQDIGAA